MTDGNGNNTGYSYNADGVCTGVTVKRTDSDGIQREYTSVYTYDEAGNVITVTNPSGEVAASNLVSGNVLLMEDGQRVYVDEVRIEKLAEEINVYNLEVDELHTYFVAGGVLVHNSCKIENSDTVIDEDIVINSANAPGKGGYETVAGHSLNKHSNRNPNIWGKLSGSSQDINSKALSIIHEISDSDKLFKIVESKVSFYEIMLDDNRGIRLNMDMTFKGFIDERR